MVIEKINCKKEGNKIVPKETSPANIDNRRREITYDTRLGICKYLSIKYVNYIGIIMWLINSDLVLKSTHWIIIMV